MVQGVNLISSGFALIDKKWGGMYRGGSYMIIGPRKSGRTLLALQFALETAKSSEICLYFTNMRPKDLMIQAASLNFDIQSYMNKNLLIVVRISPPNEIYDSPNPDDLLIDYMNDIITVVNQYNPERIIFDELTPYVGFRDVNLLRDVFVHLLEKIEEKNITSLFIVGEPATQKAQQIVDSLSGSTTANIFLKKNAEKHSGQYHGGTAIITPNVGHTEGQFFAEYIIQPYKGVTIEPADLKPIILESEEVKPTVVKEESTIKFENLDSIKQKEAGVNNDQIVFSNIYSYDDFQLIVNNQIALFKSTGQVFNLVSFQLDPVAQVRGLLSLNQLKNAVAKVVAKKDKICQVDNKVIILISRSTDQSVKEIILKMKEHLPSYDESYFKAVSDYLKLYNLKVDDKYSNSSEMLDLLLSEHGSKAHISLNELNL